MSNPLVIEVNTRCWLTDLSRTLGHRVTLDDVPDDELAGWQDAGFTHVWLMGVWETGLASRTEAWGSPALADECHRLLPDLVPDDFAGSPYAIARYQVAVGLGGNDALARFRKRLHRHEIRLILDFVPNHIGLDHAWVTEHPDWLVHARRRQPGTFRQNTRDGARWIAHGRDPFFFPWADTVQLDFRAPGLRAASIDVLRSVAQRCDGLRCDMAMLVLNDVFARTWEAFPAEGPAPQTEFWADALTAVRSQQPGFLMLAEAYWGLEERLLNLGFDFTYDKGLYDALATHAPDRVATHLAEQSDATLLRSAHFLENHDEPRAASRWAAAEHRAAALLIMGLPGLRLLHEGQLTGARVRVPVHLRRRPVESPDPVITAIYQHLLGALNGSAVGCGEGRRLEARAAWDGNPTHRNFVLVLWRNDRGEFDLVVVNLAPYRSQCFAPLAIPRLDRQDWLLTDLLGDQRHRRSGPDLAKRGLYLDVAGHAAQLFHARRL